MKNSLTKREQEILCLVLEEHTSQNIATLLQLSIRTVDTHRKNILRKTKTRTLISLFKYAVKTEMINDFVYRPELLKQIEKYT